MPLSNIASLLPLEDAPKLCDSIKSIKFEHKGSVVYIEMEFLENFRKSKNAKVAFQTGTDMRQDEKGNFLDTEKFVLKTSVKPGNF